MSDLTSIPFSPSPTLTAKVLDDFRNPTLSLRDLAAFHNTTIEALSLWLSLPEIQDRIALIDNLAALRTRSIAGDFLPAAAQTLSNILRAFNANQLTPPPDAPANNTPAPASTPTTPDARPAIPPHVHRRRAAETARRAASELLRLARFAPGPARPSSRTLPSEASHLTTHAPAPNAPGMGGTGVPPVNHTHSPLISHPSTSSNTATAPTDSRSGSSLSPHPPAHHPIPSPSSSAPLPRPPRSSPPTQDQREDIVRQAEALTASLNVPEPTDAEIDAFLTALETGDTSSLPPNLAATILQLRAGGGPVPLDQLLAHSVSRDTS